MNDDLLRLRKQIAKAKPRTEAAEWLDDDTVHPVHGLAHGVHPFFVREDLEKGTRESLGTWSVWISDRTAHGASVLIPDLPDFFTAYHRMIDCVEAYEPIRPLDRVYFIGTELRTGLPVKVGFSCDPESRLKTLQTAHPEQLQIFATVVGDKALERKYHQRWRARRRGGEWFTLGDCIINEINRLKAA